MTSQQLAGAMVGGTPAEATGSSRYSAINNWATWIEDNLENAIRGHAAKPAEEERPDRTIFRVPKSVKDRLDSKDTTWCTPEDISLGLFHRPGRSAAPQKGVEFKLQMASAFLTSIYTKEGSSVPLRKHDGPNLGPQPVPISAQSRVGQQSVDAAIDVDVDVDVRRSVEFLIATGGRSRQAWRDLCDRVVGGGGLKKAVDCYHLQEDDRVDVKDEELMDVLGRALTLDAIVVGCFFSAKYCREEELPFPFPLVKSCVDQQRVYGGVPTVDFLKLENQIPLFLSRNVLNLMWAGKESEQILNGACAKVARDFAGYFPGYDRTHYDDFVSRLQNEGKFLECDHFLDCLSLILRLPEELDNSAPSTASKVFKIPSATQLREAGVKLRGHSWSQKCDLLPVFKQGWLRSTLYIPKLPILPIVTWTLWRNIVAYECERYQGRKGDKKHHQQESQLHAFLALIDCLIDTKEDVILLTQGESPVLPDGYYSTPEDLAKKFNSILAGQLFVDYPRWVVLADKINSYHKKTLRRNVLDFLRANFGKPWLVISVIAATFLLVLTLIQTIVAILAYDPSTGSN